MGGSLKTVRRCSFSVKYCRMTARNASRISMGRHLSSGTRMVISSAWSSILQGMNPKPPGSVLVPCGGIWPQRCSSGCWVRTWNEMLGEVGYVARDGGQRRLDEWQLVVVTKSDEIGGLLVVVFRWCRVKMSWPLVELLVGVGEGWGDNLEQY